MENEKKVKLSKWKKLLLGVVGVSLVCVLSILGINLLTLSDVTLIGIMIGCAGVTTVAGVVLVVKDIVKNISYEYEYIDEYEEDDEDEYEETISDECCLRLVKDEDGVSKGRYSYHYESNSTVEFNHPPKLEIVNSNSEYVKKRKK